MRSPESKRNATIAVVAAGAIALGSAVAIKNSQGPTVSPPGKEQIEKKKSFLLSEKDIDAYREEAIATLVQSVPSGGKFNHLRDTERLRVESEMYTPSETEQNDVRRKSIAQLAILSTGTEANEYGLFVFADKPEGGDEYHRLYVMKKDAAGTMQFVLGFRISMAEKGFSFQKITGYTQLGLHYFTHSHEGNYGEIVDVLPDKLPDFKRISRDARGNDRHYVSDFNGESGEPAAVVTDRYTIDAGRGIHFHGSNRTGKWDVRSGKKVWVSNLHGAKSGACGRMAHADVRVLGRKFIKLRVVEGKNVIQHGTPIYIHATPPVMARSAKARAPHEEKDGHERTKETSSRSTESKSGGNFKPAWNQSLN